MARAKRNKITIHGLFVVVLCLGLIQLLNLYHTSHYSAEDYQTLSPSDHRTERTTIEPPKNVTQTSQTVELMRRTLTVYRNNVRKRVQNSKVILDLSLLDMKGEKFYKQTGMDIPLRQNPSRFLRPTFDPIVHGVEKEKQGYLTIGITSVKRPNTESVYVYETLDSLTQNVEEHEKPVVTVVVLLSDSNTTYNSQLADSLYTRYAHSVDTGFIRIIQAPSDMYPIFKNIQQTFNDSISRIKWRAKQNIDFAYLSLYCMNISKYYIQIEDDVVTSRNLMRDIRNFTSSQTMKWFLLEFSRLGYIGKMFHSEDLPWVANFLLTFFDKMPCDLLLGKMRGVVGQAKPIHYHHSLFQHVGRFSSLKDKLMPSLDDHFKDVGQIPLSANKLPLGRNPPVVIETDMKKAVNNTEPMNAYNNNSSSYFWVLPPVTNNYILLTFESPQNFRRIIIITGDADTKHDFLESGGLHYSSGKNNTHSARTSCGKFELMVNFFGGDIDTKAMGVSIPSNVQCLKIVIIRKSKTWVKFRNIILV